MRWGELGYPAPTVLESSYVRYSWSPTIYAATEDSPRVYSTWEDVEYTGWRVAGSPMPEVLPSSLVKYPWSSSVYAVTPHDPQWGGQESTIPVSYMEFARAGSPTPATVSWIPNSLVFTYHSGTDVYVQIGAEYHRLSYAEWRAMGSPTPTDNEMRHMRLSWSPGIVAFIDSAFYDTPGSPEWHRVYDVTYEQWARLDFPTPEVRASLPGDTTCVMADGTTLRYRGSSFDGPITYAQWQASGFLWPQGAC